MNSFLSSSTPYSFEQSPLFVGRSAELHISQKALSKGRALTICGERGAGKTSLALRVAQTLFGPAPETFHHYYVRSGANTEQIAQHIFDECPGRPSVLIVDELERAAIDAGVLIESLNEKYGPALPIILVSNVSIDLAGAQNIHLHSLSRNEASKLFSLASNYWGIPFNHSDVNQLFSLTRGSPALLLEAIALAAERGFPMADVIQALRPFGVSGLVDARGQPLHNDAAETRKIITEVTSVNSQLVDIARRDPGSLYSMPPRKFEELVAELLSRLGYDVTLTPAANDGGFDMYAAQRSDLGRFLFLVECKRYRRDRPVGVGIVRSLHGVVQQKNATAGIVATTSHFTKGAIAFENSIEYKMSLKNYADIREWLLKV